MTIEHLINWVERNAVSIRQRANNSNDPLAIESWIQAQLSTHFQTIHWGGMSEIPNHVKSKVKGESNGPIDLLYVADNSRHHFVEIKVQYAGSDYRRNRFGGANNFEVAMTGDAKKLCRFAKEMCRINCDYLLMVVTLHDGTLDDIRHWCRNEGLSCTTNEHELTPSVELESQFGRPATQRMGGVVGVAVVGSEDVFRLGDPDNSLMLRRENVDRNSGAAPV